MARLGNEKLGQHRLGTSDRVIRQNVGYVSDVSGENDRTRRAIRFPEGYLRPVSGIIMRDTLSEREQLAYVKKTLGEATSATSLERSFDVFVSPSSGTVDRTIDLVRDADGFTSSVTGDTDLTIFSDGFVNPVFGEIDRGLRSDRAVDGFMVQNDGSVNRDISVVRSPTGYAVQTVGDIERTVTLSRVTTGYTDVVKGRISRGIGRSVTGFVDVVVGGNEAAIPNYQFNGSQVSSLVEEIRTWDTMTLSFRVSKKTLTDSLRPVLQGAGKVDVVDTIQGGFDAVDRANGGNTVDVVAPTDRQDVRSVDKWKVEEYSEEVVDTGGEEWEVEVEMVPEKEKRYDNEYGTLSNPDSLSRPSNSWWKFEFENGDVVTRRVVTDVERTPDKTFKHAELSIVATPDEVRRMEENAGLLGAVNERDVPDGSDVIVDSTGSDRNVVTITPPAEGEDTIEPGEYIVQDFETVWNRAAYTLTLEIVEQVKP